MKGAGNGVGRGVAVGVGLAGAALVLMVFAGAVSATTTYTVTFTEVGLASGTSWSVTFNSVAKSTTGKTVSFSAVGSGTYYWYITTNPVAGATGTQFAGTPNSGYVTVPNQVGQFVSFQKQFQITSAVTPSGAGSTSFYYSPYFDAGAPTVISASSNVGYSFLKWTSSTTMIKIANTTAVSSGVTMGGPGTVTATFKALTYTVTFTQVGVPSGKTWTVNFNGVQTSTTAKLSVTGVTAGSYPWSVPAVAGGTGIQYTPRATYGSMNVPYQVTQMLLFTKQFLVSFSANPSSSGSVSPSGSSYYDNGSSIAVSAASTSSTVFSSWSSNSLKITLGSKSQDSTNATIAGTGTITANFKSGTPCSSCTVTFREAGLPARTGWGVQFNGSFYGGTGSTIVLKNVNGTVPYYYNYWTVQAVSSGATGIQYAPQSPTSGYLSLPYQTDQTIVFVPQYYVTITGTPVYTGGWYPYSGFYNAGQSIVVSATGTADYAFGSWTTNISSLKVAKATAASTTLLVNGPGTLTANFVSPIHSVSFAAAGLPAGTSWGVDFYNLGVGTLYWSNTTTLTIRGVASGTYYWTPTSPIGGGPGSRFASTLTSGSIHVPFQPMQALQFQQQYWVNVLTGGKTGGSVSPSGGAWYANGTTLAISAINGTANFTSWGSTSSALKLSSTSNAVGTVKITGPGTVTARFA